MGFASLSGRMRWRVTCTPFSRRNSQYARSKLLFPTLGLVRLMVRLHVEALSVLLLDWNLGDTLRREAVERWRVSRSP